MNESIAATVREVAEETVGRTRTIRIDLLVRQGSEEKKTKWPFHCPPRPHPTPPRT
jgi:hypothetical protein